MNKVILLGRLAADPELKQTKNGIPVCSFSIAVNRKFGNNEVDFINCEAWRQTAEFVSQWFEKGKQIIVVGNLQIRKWEKDGEKRTSAVVVVDEVSFAGGKNDGQATKTTTLEAEISRDKEKYFGEYTEISDEGLPF